MASEPRCWCGSADLRPFSPDYFVCGDCRTLVATVMPGGEIARVDDEEHDFYGRRYWFEYQERDLGNPDITVRARNDLPERCVYWLRTLLRYRLPPARTLDVGCGHGALVMLLSRAGYDAKGLELSPWVVDFARRTFGVPVLLGPLEAQSLKPGSLDVITMMDVLEHLVDPMATVDAAFSALCEGGILVIQTPAAPANLSWEEMVDANHPFLPLMKERGHLYLFNQTSLRRLLVESFGMRHVTFEPAYFGAYDMFVVASRQPLVAEEFPAVTKALGVSPDGRLMLALLDLDASLSDLRERHAKVERDRAARLVALHEHGARLMGAEGERNAIRADLEHIKRSLGASEADRAARLAVIQDLGERLAAAEADRAARLTVIHEQAERLVASEADRAARLTVIQEQADRLAASEADRATRLAVIQEQGSHLSALEHELAELRRQLSKVEADRAEKIRVANEREDRLQALAAQSERMSAELTALRDRSMRAKTQKAVRRLRAGVRALTRPSGGERDTPPTETASVTASPAPSAASTALRPADPVTLYESLDDYARSIDMFVEKRPDMAPVRVYNHAMVDELDASAPLAGLTLLDVGASPHGFSLERVLEKGAAAYLGVGLGVSEHVEIRHHMAVGRLLDAYGDALPVESESVDVVISLSTFEHFLDVTAVLREIHRVLRPGGRLFANFQPIWTSSAGHHLHQLQSIARLIPPWAHLLWTPDTMRRALARRWPSDAPMSMEDAVRWVYESHEINRLDVASLRQMFEAAPFTIEWMSPLPDDESDDKPRVAAYLSTLLPYSAEELLTRGFSLMMRKA
jgi:2-polyprenyl-3-methyl-5-hydroxy-6-metoxy-1,4-benzoquinol methylase